MNRKEFIALLGIAPLVMSIQKLSALDKLAQSNINSPKMPVLFIGHGNPMNAIENNEFVQGFKSIAQSIPKPTAIVCISAHWLTKGSKVTAMAHPKTIYDFYGFPDELYQVNYPAKGNTELAKTTQNILSPTIVELDQDWGLDHGTWTVLVHMYPNADIPVIQLSIDSTKPASYHYELASRLNNLRNKGVLIMGSGNIVHNLGLVDFKNMHKDNYGYDWAVEARQIVNNHLIEGNHKPLLEYEKLGQSLKLAVPSPDHYLPMIYALGLKQADDNIELFNDKLLAGSLSMTSFKLH